MKLIFIIPRYTVAGSYYAPPLGIGYVMAILKECNYDVRVINLNETTQSLGGILTGFNPVQDIILVGGLSAHYPEISAIMQTVNRLEFTSILGGGILSSDPEFILDLLKPTYGVIGEGEIATLQLIKDIEAGKANKKIYSHEDGNVDCFPHPAYGLIGIPKLLEEMNPIDEPYFQATDNPRMIPMVLSRSCPYSCSFCFHPIGNKYRRRSLGPIFHEIEQVYQAYRPNVFMFLDELFSTDKKWTHEFCRMIKRYPVSWICQLRVDSVDEETLKNLKDAGCVCISYGIESINDNVLKAMGKHTTKADIEKALALTYKNKIGIQGNLIFGTSGETVESYKESIAWWKANRRYMLNLIPAVAYPGTAMYARAMDWGKIPDKKRYLQDRCPPVNTTIMSDGEYQDMLAEINHLQHDPDSGFINTDATVKGQGEKKRGYDLVTVSYTCAHCGKRNDFKNILSGYPTGRNFLRYACRHCNQRADFKERI